MNFRVARQRWHLNCSCPELLGLLAKTTSPADEVSGSSSKGGWAAEIAPPQRGDRHAFLAMAAHIITT